MSSSQSVTQAAVASAPEPRVAKPDPAADRRADAVVKAFNTWAFKREQPSDADLLKRTVARAVAADEPVPFVLYWGKGPRADAGKPEADCLAYLSSMADRIAKAYAPGALFHILFTDTHARLNGHAERVTSGYFAGVEALFDRARFRGHRLSAVVERHYCAEACHTLPDAATLRQLTACAGKWFGGEGSPAEAARRYYAMNMVERRAVERGFPDAVFVTFNGSDVSCLFPDQMPVFYMYSLKKGLAVKPWFMDADGTPVAGLASREAA